MASGAVGSPKLLLLSGIGPAAELAAVGVQPVHDLPGVGQNLQDHIDVYVINELPARSARQAYAAAPDALGRAAVRPVPQRAGDLQPRRGRGVLVRRPGRSARPTSSSISSPGPGSRRACRRWRATAARSTPAICARKPRQVALQSADPMAPPEIDRTTGPSPTTSRCRCAASSSPARSGPAGVPELPQARAPAGRPVGPARTSRPTRALRQDRLPPGRHLQDGRRCDGGGRPRSYASAASSGCG